MSAALERTTFSTSRLLEFFSEKELQMQIGHARQAWPLALVKELIDNALDACETRDTAPDIRVIVEPDAVSVQDNGPGLPVETLKKSLDYGMRVSDKVYYASPSRGQLGNALKCVWAAPFVVNGGYGCVEVTTGGVTHRIEVSLDRVAQLPKLAHSSHPDDVVKTGTCVKMYWPEVAGYLDTPETASFSRAYGIANIRDLICQYAACNPHATFSLVSGGEWTVQANNIAWRKWRPSNPTSPHWYTEDSLRALVAAYLAAERAGGRALTVRAFVSEFTGLSGTVKQKGVTEGAGLAGAYLHDLVENDGVAMEPVRRLLRAMREASRPVKATSLGVIGKAHLAQMLIRHISVAPDSVRYRKVEGDAGGTPFVLEAAFGVLDGLIFEPRCLATIGLNWSPALGNPFADLESLLAEAQVDRGDPVRIIIHLACPRLAFTDRGKTRLSWTPGFAEALATAVQAVTKEWTVRKRQVARDERMRERELEELRRRRQRRALNVKQAAYRVMEEAYMLASDHNRLPANARQIMYAARPLVLHLTDGRCWKDSSYFTQHLLPDFIAEHRELAADWDVVFDARGHLTEPHTRRQIGLGTLEVRRYMRDWPQRFHETVDHVSIGGGIPTFGPTNRYGFVLFIEKEGFNELLTAAQIADRYDLAIMSTKGMSVTASRQLIERLSAQGVTILALHDFDKAGLSILNTMRSDTRRYQFQSEPKVVDLGLRLDDVRAMNLQSERQEHPARVDPRVNLRESGATEDECNFLVRGRSGSGWWGERVELNAMTSPQFIAFLERKLAAAGVTKVVPSVAVLDVAYRRAWRQASLQQEIDRLVQQFNTSDHDVNVPDDLGALLRERIAGKSSSWDKELWALVVERSERERKN